MDNQFSRALAPIDRSGITELVVQRIKELLQQGELKAGSRLPPERELADMLSISRPSLRTALKALSVMGIIRAKPGAGTFIADSLPEIFAEPMAFMTLIHNTTTAELFEARRIIEAGLVELAAERATSEQLKAIAAEIEGMRKSFHDPEKFLTHDVRFHQALAIASGNQVMSGVMDTVATLLLQVRLDSIARSTDQEEAIDWHERIYEAVRQRESRRAKEILTAHLVSAEKAWEKDNRKPAASIEKKGRAKK
jgi:GntR family transcriptional regulator, transcriptional repressor for pyruvate dehydrogenase complex